MVYPGFKRILICFNNGDVGYALVEMIANNAFIVKYFDINYVKFEDGEEWKKNLIINVIVLGGIVLGKGARLYRENILECVREYKRKLSD